MSSLNHIAFEQQNRRNVLSEVVIDSIMAEHFFSILADFSDTLRFRDGFHTVVKIESESGFIHNSGELIVDFQLNGELLQIHMPAEAWRWKSDLVTKDISN